MEHHPPLYRHAGNLFARTLTLSLALHLALAVVAVLLPGRVALFAPERIVMVDLSDASPQLPQVSRNTTAVQPPASPLQREMSLPSPTEKILPASPPTPVEEVSPPPPPQAAGSSLSLGLTRGFFRSLADGETLRGDVRDYYFALVERVNEQWWSAGGGTDVEPGRREALVTITVRKSGEIFDVRLVKSSGNDEYDRMVIDAIQAASHLPPLPESYPGEFFQAPLRLMAPRGLLFS